MNRNKDVFRNTQRTFDHGSSPGSPIDTNKLLVYDGVSKARLPKVNDLVDVLWDAQNEWFRGRLLKQRGRIRVFRFDILYDDGDFLTHDLNEEHWRFVNDPGKTFEPGEVEELRRDLEEQSFSIPTAAPIRKKRTFDRRGTRSTNNGATQSMSALPTMGKRRMPRNVNGKNDAMKSESVLPNLDNSHQNVSDYKCRGMLFQPINDASSPLSIRSLEGSHIQTSGHCNDMVNHSAIGESSMHGNDETHLPFRKRRVVRPSGNEWNM